MTTAERKEIAYLHRDLCNVLTNCDTDKQFYKRLLWAQQWIEKELSVFTPEEIDQYEGGD